MGFGLLFIGYFFLINITYYAYTDIIGAAVMLMALYKLSTVNGSFRACMIADGAFALFSLGELVIAVLDAFGVWSASELILAYIAAARYILIFILTVIMLRGIREVALEVDAGALATSAKTSIPLAVIYLVIAFLNLPFESLLGAATPYVFLVAVIALVVYHISNLITVYKAYMQICMPGDEGKKRKKHGWSDKIYDRIEERTKEYNEYKLGRKKTTNKKRKGGK